MSPTHPDLCSGGCAKFIITSNPLGLCPECYSRWTLRGHKERAWRYAPRKTKLLIISLYVLSVVAGLVAAQCFYWTALPAIYRALRNPLIIIAGIALCWISRKCYKAAEAKKLQLESSVIKLW